MRILKIAACGAALMLAACQEPQIADVIATKPSTAFNIEVIGAGLQNPWSVSELPDGTLLVTEKAGRLYRYQSWGRQTLGGLPDDIYVSGQGGLLDVVAAPDFEQTREIYLSYSYGNDDENGTALLRARLPENKLDNVDIENAVVIFRADPPKAAASHFGGKIAFLPDDSLVLTLGDGFAYREDAQKGGTHLGKLVRMMRDGSVPEDNPFSSVTRDENGKIKSQDISLHLPHVYSIGHRNVQGLAYDAQSGVLWEHEHGPRGGDELNRIEPGANYGWPLATTGRDYQGARISPYETFPGTVDPVHDWVPSIAPSGLTIYRGEMFPEWDGDALIGGLASRDLRRVDLENGQSVGEESLLADLDERIRDVRTARDGSVIILTEDAENGRLLRLTPK